MAICDIENRECEFVEDCTKLKDKINGLDGMKFKCPILTKEDECVNEWISKILKAILVDNDYDQVPKIIEAMDEACNNCPDYDKHRGLQEGDPDV